MSDKKKILVVEDDKFLANAYRVKLGREGFDLKLAFDGLEALEVLKEFTPDVIILDLVMPRLDGFGTLEKIKADEKLKKIPVLIASNLGQKEDIDRGAQLGAEGYVVKSDLSMEELLEKIKKVIE